MKTRKIWFLSWTLIMLMCLASIATANANNKKRTIGLSIFYGRQLFSNSILLTSKEYNWSYIILHPSMGWMLSDRWEIYLEGNIGQYNFEKTNDTSSCGICIMTAYDFAKLNKWSLFVECGGGFGLWNKTLSKKLVDKGLLGYIQCGTGLRIPIKNDVFLNLAYRFTHTSAVFARDDGANTHGILFGIKKVW